MDLQLEDKRALVTGSSSGIGRAIARALAAEGVSVIVHGRSPESALRVSQEIESAGGRARVATADLTEQADVERLAAESVAALGAIDILVNNAGAYADHSWTEARPQDWLGLYNANVVSAVRLIGCLLPTMRAAGWGRVIQISSGEASQPFAFMPDYAATKAALVNLTVSLAKELAGTGVTANTVSPGIIVTEGIETFYRNQARQRGWGEAWEDIERGIVRDVLPNPTGRLGRIDEVADLVTFVASPRSGYINGANLRIDGGSCASVN